MRQIGKNLFTDTAQLYQLAKSALKSAPTYPKARLIPRLWRDLRRALKIFYHDQPADADRPLDPSSVRPQPYRLDRQKAMQSLEKMIRAGKPIFDTRRFKLRATPSDTSSDNSASSDDSGTTDATSPDTTAELPIPSRDDRIRRRWVDQHWGTRRPDDGSIR